MKPTLALPAGFANLMNSLAAAKKASTPTKPKRRGLLADVERAIALGNEPPALVFQSLGNYTYNRHADALHKAWQAKDLATLEAYPLTGKNTYARALAKYRELLVANLRSAS